MYGQRDKLGDVNRFIDRLFFHFRLERSLLAAHAVNWEKSQLATLVIRQPAGCADHPALSASVAQPAQKF